MASSRRQFMSMYEESVRLLRFFKQNNDSLNKSIGIESDSSVLLKVKAEEMQHKQSMQNIDKLLAKMEQNYLDPETARKVGAVKQQYKIQKDRHQHLLESLSDAQTQDSVTSFPSQPYHATRGDKDPYYSRLSRNDRNSENQSGAEIRNSRTQQTASEYTEQIDSHDYEIESRMISERSQALKHAQKSLMNVYNISKQTAEMVNYQGEQLDVISDEIFKTDKNTKHAVTQLQEANRQQQKSRRKYITFSLIVIVAAAVVLMFALM